MRARPAGRLERAAKWAKRNPVVAALLAVVLVVSASGLAGILWHYGKAVEGERNATRAKLDAQQAQREAEESALKSDFDRMFAEVDRDEAVRSKNEETRALAGTHACSIPVPRHAQEGEAPRAYRRFTRCRRCLRRRWQAR